MQQDETGRFDGQRIDVDAVKTALDEIETVQIRVVNHGQIQCGLQEHAGAASGVEDVRWLGPRAELTDSLACDVLGNVRGGVEGSARPFRLTGLPRGRSLHHTRPAPGAMRVKDVRQEITQCVVVPDRLECLDRFAIGELDDGVGKQARRAQAPEKPRLGIVQRCVRGKHSDAAAHDAHADEAPGRLKSRCLGRGEGLFAPPAGQHVRPCGADGFVVAEGAPHGLDGRSDVDGIRLRGGDQRGAGRRNGPAGPDERFCKRGGHDPSSPRLRGNSGVRASR